MRHFRKKLVRHRLTLLGVLAWSLHAPVMAKPQPARAPQTQGKLSQYAIPSGPSSAQKTKKTFRQTGRASWYGLSPKLNLHTASGELLNPHDFTGAHPTLPFGTRVKVTNLQNGRSTQVRINDRGPYAGGRIIDLSYAAARDLGMMGRGVARVRIEVLPRDKKQVAEMQADLVAGGVH